MAPATAPQPLLLAALASAYLGGTASQGSVKLSCPMGSVQVLRHPGENATVRWAAQVSELAASRAVL